ncbi:J domain-containing protein [Methylobacter sp.]|uniref:J domain-containing protein n=1 Tax=Methylobacter sp. TaxID=2051955 RepID=UPI002FDEE680
MPEFRTHYDNLKIRRNASNATIRAAYKALMQKYHPDKFDGSVQEALRITKIIQHSYEILIHFDKRAKHDRWISELEAKFRQKYGSTEFGIVGKIQRNILIIKYMIRISTARRSCIELPRMRFLQK